MTVRILLLAAVVAFAGINDALKAQEHKPINPPATQITSERPEPGRRLGDKPMKLTHDEIVKELGTNLVHHEHISGLFSQALGNYGYLVRSPDLNEILDIVNFIHKPSA